MKKFSIYALSLAMFSLAACDETFDDWADPQGFEQEEMIGTSFSVSAVSPIDLASVTTERVALFNATAELAGGAITGYVVTLDGVQIAVESDGSAATADLANLVTGLYGKRPQARELAMKVRGVARIGDESISLTASPVVLTVTPEAPVIEEKHYLVGGINGWSLTDGAYPFSHSGKDVYEDPVFSIVVDIPEDALEFKVAPLSSHNGEDADWNNVYGVDKENEGKIVQGGEGGNFSVPAAGKYRVSLNLLDMTYTVEELAFNPFIYEIGNDSGWNVCNPLAGPNFDGQYCGYYYLDGEFKFKPNPGNDWDGDWEYNGEGLLTADGKDNIPGVTGFYQINVDLAAMTYALTKVESLSLIGDFNSWGGDVEMTYNQEGGYWETTVEIPADGGLKIRMNHDWAVNWGGNGSGDNFDDLTQDGANLNFKAGTYTLKFYLSYEGNNKLVVE